MTLGPMTLIAGPCVIEDEGLVHEVAQELKRQTADLPVKLFFKASFDKANRTSIEGFRGPGMKDGLKILAGVKAKTGLPLLTDFHTPEQAETVADVVDFLQIPAFLCRQTDMIVAGAEAALRRGKKLNVKKGQFLAPWDAGNIVSKVREVEAKLGKKFARDDFFITERGVSFGYNTLVVDMVSFQTIQRFGVPVVYDATHSIQSPGGGPAARGTPQRLFDVPATIGGASSLPSADTEGSSCAFSSDMRATRAKLGDWLDRSLAEAGRASR